MLLEHITVGLRPKIKKNNFAKIVTIRILPAQLYRTKRSCDPHESRAMYPQTGSWSHFRATSFNDGCGEHPPPPKAKSTDSSVIAVPAGHLSSSCVLFLMSNLNISPDFVGFSSFPKTQEKGKMMSLRSGTSRFETDLAESADSDSALDDADDELSGVALFDLAPAIISLK